MTLSPPAPVPPASRAPAAVPVDPFAAGVIELADRLRAFVRSRVHSAADAEDLTQDVMLKVFRSRHTLRDPAKLEAWLYRTARSTIIDHYRRRRETAPVTEDLTPTPGPDFDRIGERLQRSVRRFVHALPDTYRRAIELAELEARPVAEVARTLGLSLTATKSRLARGRELLRSRLFACCHFEVDAFGRAVDFHQRDAAACDCQVRDAPSPLRSASSRPPIGPTVRYELARATDLPAIQALLATAGLPTADLGPESWLHFVVARSGPRLVGAIAVEPHDPLGWLRSLVVAADRRGAGVGAHLVAEAVRLARQLGQTELWLLTTTAAPFFAALGFAPVDRALAPAAVRATDQFCSLCPTSAILMHRRVKAPAAKPRGRPSGAAPAR